MSSAIISQQTVDPEVSKIKFDRELKNFRLIEKYNKERGVILLRASFPDIVLAFSAAMIRPVIVAFAVNINFDNYDLEAPSIKFVDPLTENPVIMNQLLTHMPRKIVDKNINTQIEGQFQDPVSFNCLIQSHPPDQIPFLCFSGVREYHDHPFHSNDPWFAHRNTGEGTLGFLVDQLHKYGTDSINGFRPQNFNVQQIGSEIFQIQSSGLILTVDLNRISK